MILVEIRVTYPCVPYVIRLEKVTKRYGTTLYIKRFHYIFWDLLLLPEPVIWFESIISYSSLQRSLREKQPRGENGKWPNARLCVAWLGFLENTSYCPYAVYIRFCAWCLTVFWFRRLWLSFFLGGSSTYLAMSYLCFCSHILFQINEAKYTTSVSTWIQPHSWIEPPPPRIHAKSNVSRATMFQGRPCIA